jgi:hypothetical protein
VFSSNLGWGTRYPGLSFPLFLQAKVMRVAGVDHDHFLPNPFSFAMNPFDAEGIIRKLEIFSNTAK